MNAWFWYAVGAAVLYGMHQIFTKLASDRISDGLGGFVVEGSAALTILVYLGALWVSGISLQRIDPQSDRVSGMVDVNSTSVTAGFGSLWITDVSGRVERITPGS